MSVRKNILAFGETLWDLLPSGPALGGAPFNFSYRATALGDCGIIVTRLGRDDHGRKAVEQIAALGMETSYIQRDEQHLTGTVEVKFDENRNPDYHIVPDAAYDFLDLSYELMELAGRVDCFCFGTVAQRAEKSRRTLHRLLDLAGNALKFFDINLRKDCYALETIVNSLAKADILKMNLQEAHYLAELFEISISSLPDFCAEITEQRSLKCCLVTMGEHGAFAATVDGTRVYVPGYQVQLADTCGSGDAFSAGFVHEYLQGKPLADCCLLGNMLGAIVSQQNGATMPVSAADIQHFRETEHRMFHEPTLKQFSVG